MPKHYFFAYSETPSDVVHACTIVLRGQADIFVTPEMYSLTSIPDGHYVTVKND